MPVRIKAHLAESYFLRQLGSSMSFPDVPNAVPHWAFLPTLVRLALALGTGAFVGLEREHRGKAGARTFTFASLIGCLGAGL